MPRPAFKAPGYWLDGYGLSLHIIETTVPEERQQVLASRIKHFSESTRIDHIAFETDNIDYVQSILESHHVYYKRDNPAGNLGQIFIFDPDYNDIEITNGDVTNAFHKEQSYSLNHQGDRAKPPHQAELSSYSNIFNISREEGQDHPDRNGCASAPGSRASSTCGYETDGEEQDEEEEKEDGVSYNYLVASFTRNATPKAQETHDDYCQLYFCS